MTFETIIAWNTGCRYTAAGQRIAAGVTKDRKVYFVDTDRMIGGLLFDRWRGAMLRLDPEWIHNRYLRNEYRSLCISNDEWKALDRCANQVADYDHA